MPIRRELRSLYQAHWSELSRRVRFGRSGGVCEVSGRPHAVLLYRTGDGTIRHGKRGATDMGTLLAGLIWSRSLRYSRFMYNAQYSMDTLASIFGMESILQPDTPDCPIERRGEISTGFQF